MKLACIAEGRTLNDPRRPDFSAQQFLRSPEEMAELFSDIPEALENTVHIAERCSAEISLGEFLPDFPTPEGVSIGEHLEHLSEGPATATRTQGRRRAALLRRLKFELDVINEMGSLATSVVMTSSAGVRPTVFLPSRQARVLARWSPMRSRLLI